MSTRYNNFVRASSNEPEPNVIHYQAKISGDEAKRLYLEEIKESNTKCKPSHSRTKEQTKRRKVDQDEVPSKNIFVCAQDNDVETLRIILDVFPDRLNAVDDYGWSLLMIACQANSVETVKELLERGIDPNIRDKAGNSARSLVIKNKNIIIADLLLSHSKEIEKSKNVKEKQEKSEQCINQYKIINDKDLKCKYVCEICKEEYNNREDHLSSTIHNINASKDRKIPTNYVIPRTNKGYQIMLKVGWDRETGLGRDGSGNKYPIKAVEKKDRKGLGHEKKQVEQVKETNKTINKKIVDRYKRRNRRFERNFRREFY